MKNKLLILLLVSTFAFSHIDEKVLYDFEKKCMICHDTYNKNDKAPPIVAINQIYTKKTSGDLSLSKKMIINFLANPTYDKALMKPAIKLYSLMQKQDIELEDMGNFADVILETNFEIPEWFDEHFDSHKLDLENKNID